MPSEKRPGNTVKHQPCNGTGTRVVSYTRVTTFIDVLEDKKNLEAWSNRMVLIGIAKDTGFLTGVLDHDPEAKEGKDALNRLAAAAKEYAGADDKADKGTFLHALSEMADRHEELPLDVDPQDWLDIQSYVTITHPLLHIVHMEKLVVNDHYKVAGTPDRVSSVLPGVTLRAPNGYIFQPDELIITDLKTGRTDYGQLKMAMQLSIYANSDLYVLSDGSRSPLEGINRDWGLIMHTPAGKGVTTLYWADLRMGWAAVELAHRVREARRTGRKALIPFATTDASLVEEPAA